MTLKRQDKRHANHEECYPNKHKIYDRYTRLLVLLSVGKGRFHQTRFKLVSEFWTTYLQCGGVSYTRMDIYENLGVNSENGFKWIYYK